MTDPILTLEAPLLFDTPSGPPDYARYLEALNDRLRPFGQRLHRSHAPVEGTALFSGRGFHVLLSPADAPLPADTFAAALASPHADPAPTEFAPLLEAHVCHLDVRVADGPFPKTQEMIALETKLGIVDDAKPADPSLKARVLHQALLALLETLERPPTAIHLRQSDRLLTPEGLHALPETELLSAPALTADAVTAAKGARGQPAIGSTASGADAGAEGTAESKTEDKTEAGPAHEPAPADPEPAEDEEPREALPGAPAENGGVLQLVSPLSEAAARDEPGKPPAPENVSGAEGEGDKQVLRLMSPLSGTGSDQPSQSPEAEDVSAAEQESDEQMLRLLSPLLEAAALHAREQTSPEPEDRAAPAADSDENVSQLQSPLSEAAEQDEPAQSPPEPEDPAAAQDAEEELRRVPPVGEPAAPDQSLQSPLMPEDLWAMPEDLPAAPEADAEPAAGAPAAKPEQEPDPTAAHGTAAPSLRRLVASGIDRAYNPEPAENMWRHLLIAVAIVLVAPLPGFVLLIFTLIRGPLPMLTAICAALGLANLVLQASSYFSLLG